MASASDTSLLSSMEQAEKDLAMYAAIIGCRPSVDAPPAEAAPIADQPEEPPHAPLITPAPEWAIPHPSIAAEPSQPGRLSIWMRHVSFEARKRIHEAKARLIA